MKTDKLRAEWFWVDRWDASSAALLTMEQQGVYRTMLSQAWLRGARLPNDEQQIQRAIRCTPGEWERSWPAIKGYWRVDGDWIVNDTQLEVYLKTKLELERKHEKAMKAAAATPQVRRKREAEENLKVDPEVTPKDKDLDKETDRAPDPEDEAAPAAQTEHVTAMLEHQRSEYAHQVWDAFLAKTGFPATRSMGPLDWTPLKNWMDADVPLRIVLTAIRETKGKGGTLGYYTNSVKAEWDRVRRGRVSAEA